MISIDNPSVEISREENPAIWEQALHIFEGHDRLGQSSCCLP